MNNNCPDPSCFGTPEPEQDGDTTYWVCPDCQYHFGYQRSPEPDDNCAVGISETVRRAASRPMTQTLTADQAPLLQIGRPPHVADRPEGRQPRR